MDALTRSLHSFLVHIGLNPMSITPQMEHYLEHLLFLLPPEEEEAVTHYYGLFGCERKSLQEIARELEMEARDLNSFLRDKGIQKWKQGQYRLTPQYEGLGLTHDRLFIYYSKDGKQKERTYLVWTPKGAEMIDKMIFDKAAIK